MIEQRTSLSQEFLTETQERLSLQLFEIGAIKFGDFKLKLHDRHPEAPLSPIYVDLRVLRRFPEVNEVKQTAVEVYQELVRPLRFDLLADIPTAATPLVSSLSDRLGVGMITPRTDVKTHGTGTKIDGLLDSDRGKVAVLIDDLVTRADSKLEAVNILKEQGIRVNDIVVLVDREQGGKKQLSAQGLTLHAALTMSDMLAFYVRVGKMNNVNYRDIIRKIDALNKFFSLEQPH